MTYRDTIRHDAQVSEEHSRPLAPSPLFRVEPGYEINLEKVLGYEVLDQTKTLLLCTADSNYVELPWSIRDRFIAAWRAWVDRPRGQA